MGIGAYQRNTISARLTALEPHAARLVRHRPRLAIQRPNAIEHASLEFRADLDVHVSRVERLMVGPQRDGRECQTSRKYVALTTQRSETPPSPQAAISTQAARCAFALSAVRNIVLRAT
jgi:hypothetical protein